MTLKGLSERLHRAVIDRDDFNRGREGRLGSDTREDCKVELPGVEYGFKHWSADVSRGLRESINLQRERHQRAAGTTHTNDGYVLDDNHFVDDKICRCLKMEKFVFDGETCGPTRRCDEIEKRNHLEGFQHNLYACPERHDCWLCGIFPIKLSRMR